MIDQTAVGREPDPDPDDPSDMPERRREGPIAEQGTNREPPPKDEPPSWTGDDQGTTDEPAKD